MIIIIGETHVQHNEHAVGCIQQRVVPFNWLIKMTRCRKNLFNSHMPLVEDH